MLLCLTVLHASVRVRVFAGEDWPLTPATAASKALDAEVLHLGPFAISPTSFQVAKGGGSVVLTIRFAPPELGTFTRNFVVVCDNCDVTHHSVTATSTDLAVYVSDVHGRALPPPPPEVFAKGSVPLPLQSALAVVNSSSPMGSSAASRGNDRSVSWPQRALCPVLLF